MRLVVKYSKWSWVCGKNVSLFVLWILFPWQLKFIWKKLEDEDVFFDRNHQKRHICDFMTRAKWCFFCLLTYQPLNPPPRPSATLCLLDEEWVGMASGRFWHHGEVPIQFIFLVDDNNYNTLMNKISLQIFGLKDVYFKQLSRRCHTRNKVSVNLFVFTWL